MKNALVLLFLVSGMVVFGQSAKKQHEQLRAELAVEQQKHDSIFRAFAQLNKEQEHLKDQFKSEKQRFITESSNTLFCRDSIAKLQYDLKRLGRGPDLSDVQKQMRMSNGWYFLQSVLGMNKEIEPLDSVGSALDLNGLNRKQQNQQLTVKLTEYRNLAKRNELRMQQNESGIKQLESAIALLDSASLVYENATRILAAKKRSLNSQFNELRENYRLKGPKGFPDAYRDLFPEIHPVATKEKLPDDLFNGVIPPKYYSDHDVVAPPPVEAPRNRQEPEIYMIVDEPAEFPGGMTALKKYIEDHLQYPPSAKELAIQGKVYVKFVVSDKGKISSIEVKKGIPDCPDCDKEALRMLKEMPDWIPGKTNGKPVKSYFHLPVTFKIN